MKVQPRQSASRPGSRLDCRRGNESAASSSVRRPRVPRCGTERPGGQASWRAVTLANACRAEIESPREAVRGGIAGSRALRNWAKADVVGEELVKCTRRTAGIRGAALQHRKADSKRDGPGDQPWMAQAAGTPPIRRRPKRRREAPGSAHGLVGAKKGGNAPGAKEPWARTVR